MQAVGHKRIARAADYSVKIFGSDFHFSTNAWINKITPAIIKDNVVKSGAFGIEKDFSDEAIMVIGKARVKMLVIKLAGAKESARYQVKTYPNKNALTIPIFSQLNALRL